ncbi:MAG: 2-oxoacid:acceptor oxidoreductase family protein [Parcubacteria group bacterium]|nr:2-oxoacid:acceptor oxidoreductase family protein [Parcubacteria group bacterium]
MTLEIKFHARAGQGSKTMAQFMAEAAAEQGQFAQAFPYYGPARGGAPMDAFTRISDKPIRIHTLIIDPDILVVVDETLLASQKMLCNMKKDQVLLINSKKTAKEIATEYKCPATKIYALDASGIAIKNLKRDMANTSLLGALVKIVDQVELNDLNKIVEQKFGKKLGPELTALNIKTIKEGYDSIE